jgi:ABC-type nitrate/sulfonate/bicarbonate transport system permease component
LVLAWEAWVVIQDTEPYVLPSPGRIVGAAWTSAPILPGHVGVTLFEAVAGLLLGALVGVAVAVAVAAVPLVRRVLEPLLVVSQTIPMLVLAPLLVLWFGFGLTPKVVVVALIAFFPVAVSTSQGLRGADRDLVELVRGMGASPRQTLRMVQLPAAVPAFFSGLRIAAAYSVAGAVVGEWVGAERGLGIFITRSQASYRVDRIFVAVVLIAVLSMALFTLVTRIGHLAAPWDHRPGTAGPEPRKEQR